ncbi:hypothetical protein C8T65DRAFT_700155 [Cerioporus squamosus]|nr:hypothetical protein C8T65DRAFT_700155 [Cerioporus squamosus]
MPQTAQGLEAPCLDKEMRWTELPINDWFKTCVPLSRDAPHDLKLDERIDVDLKNKGFGMCPGVGRLFNAWLAKLNCGQYSTFRTVDHKDKSTSQLKDEWYNADRPDLVIYPTHATAMNAYQLSPEKGSRTQAGSTDDSTMLGVSEAAASGSTGEASSTDPSDVRASADDTTVGAASRDEASPSGAQEAAANPHRAERAHMSWDWADLLIEVKHDKKRFPWGPKNLTPASLDATKARGQLVEYAQETMGYQHRTSVFMVVFCEETARLVRFDRNGASVSESFDYAAGPSVLGKFLYGLYRPELPRKVRGHDPTATLASDADARLFRSSCTLFHLRDDSAEYVGLQQAASSDSPVYDLTITAQWSRSGRSVQKGTPVFTRRYLVGRPKQLPHSLVGRGTRPFIACERRQLRAAQAAANSGVPYECEPGAVVFIKDYWRADSDRIMTELEAYQRLWESPPADGKLLFPTPIGAGDVYDLPDDVTDENGVDDNFPSQVESFVDEFDKEVDEDDDDQDDEDDVDEDEDDEDKDKDSDSDADEQRASSSHDMDVAGRDDDDESGRTGSSHKLLPSPQATLTQADMHFDDEEQPLLPRVHTRLIIKEVCRSLEDFKTPMELLYAIYRSIIAHKHAWEIAGILHRDVSVGNILIYDQPGNKKSPILGLLSDWDLAKTKEQLQGPATQRTRSGTWQFMSALLQQYPDWPHGLSEDLESFMHVLNWCILKFFPHDLTNESEPLQLVHHMRNIYDEAYPIAQPVYSGKTQSRKGSYAKYMNVRNGTPFIMGLPVAQVSLPAAASVDGNEAPPTKATISHPLTALVAALSELCKDHYATLDLPTNSQDSDNVFSIVKVPAPTRSTAWGWDLRLGFDNSAETSTAADLPSREVNFVQSTPAKPSPLLDHKAILLAFNAALQSPYLSEDYKLLWPNFAKTQDQCPYNLTALLASGAGTGSRTYLYNSEGGLTHISLPIRVRLRLAVQAHAELPVARPIRPPVHLHTPEAAMRTQHFRIELRESSGRRAFGIIIFPGSPTPPAPTCSLIVHTLSPQTSGGAGSTSLNSRVRVERPKMSLLNLFMFDMYFNCVVSTPGIKGMGSCVWKYQTDWHCAHRLAAFLLRTERPRLCAILANASKSSGATGRRAEDLKRASLGFLSTGKLAGTRRAFNVTYCNSSFTSIDGLLTWMNALPVAGAFDFDCSEIHCAQSSAVS